jgi:hypothetical protein
MVGGAANKPPTNAMIDAMYDFMAEGPAKNAALRIATTPVVPDAQGGQPTTQLPAQANTQPLAAPAPPITLIVNTTAPEKEEPAPEPAPRAPVVAAPSLAISSLPVVANGEVLPATTAVVPATPVPESDIKIVKVDQPI